MRRFGFDLRVTLIATALFWIGSHPAFGQVRPAARPTLLAPVLMRLPSAQTATPPSDRNGHVGLGAQPANAGRSHTARSQTLEQVAREADTHTQRGFELADRGAFHSAREEFVIALRILTQALDAEYGTQEHAKALAEGLRALEEADDFSPKGARLEADLQLEEVLAGHRTPVLKNKSVAGLTPMLAMRAYLTFAQQRLAESVGSEFAGSMALYAFGKLHRVMGQELSGSMVASDAKALAVLQAAILARPNNAMASNELGTLLATAGRLEDARRLLEHSVRSWPSQVAWRNLSVVYGRLGDPNAASLAAARAQALGASPSGGSEAGSGNVPVEWVSTEEFQKTQSDKGAYERPNAPAPNAGPVPKTAAAPGQANSEKAASKKTGFFKF